MSATLVNLTGFTPSVPEDEAGMNVETVTISATSKKIEVPNKSGNTRGTYYHDKRISYDISGETTGNISATIGGVLVVANVLAYSLGGISTGAIIAEEVSITRSREAMQKVSIKATQCEDQTVA